MSSRVLDFQISRRLDSRLFGLMFSRFYGKSGNIEIWNSRNLETYRNLEIWKSRNLQITGRTSVNVGVRIELPI